MVEPNTKKKSLMSTNFEQFKILFWKNFILQRRSILGTILEICLPALFAIILLPIRKIVIADYHANDTVFQSFSVNKLPSNLTNTAGIPWFFGYQPNSTFINNIMKNVANDIGINPIRKYH